MMEVRRDRFLGQKNNIPTSLDQRLGMDGMRDSISIGGISEGVLGSLVLSVQVIFAALSIFQKASW